MHFLLALLFPLPKMTLTGFSLMGELTVQVLLSSLHQTLSLLWLMRSSFCTIPSIGMVCHLHNSSRLTGNLWQCLFPKATSTRILHTSCLTEFKKFRLILSDIWCDFWGCPVQSQENGCVWWPLYDPSNSGYSMVPSMVPSEPLHLHTYTIHTHPYIFLLPAAFAHMLLSIFHRNLQRQRLQIFFLLPWHFLATLAYLKRLLP